MKRSILVVDDNADIRTLLNDYLVQHGMAVATAESGRQAEKMTLGQHFDLVITDIRMNDGDGIELLETLRSRDPVHPPVFVMSAYADFGIAEALSRGALELLTKPIGLADLLSLVRQQLDSGRDFSGHVVGQHNIMLRYKSRASAFAGETLQLGNGGCFVAGLTALPPDSLAEFSILFEEEDETWTGCARLRWTRNRGHQRFLAGYGLQFLRLDDPLREWFLSQRQEQTTAELIPVGLSKAPI